MKILKCLPFLFNAIFITDISFSQIDKIISLSNWNKAGLIINNEFGHQSRVTTLTNTEDINRFIDFSSFEEYNFIKDFNGDNTGKTDNSELLSNALDSTPDSIVIYFPSGTYLFNNALNIPSNKILIGRSPTTTLFKFNLENRNLPLITVQGERTKLFVSIDSVGPIGSNFIYLNETSTLDKGDIIELEIENDPSILPKAENWAKNAIGQIFKVDSIRANIIYLNKKILHHYNSGFKRELYLLDPVKNSGISRLSIQRIDSGKSPTFYIDIGMNINLRCLNSQMAGTNHVQLVSTINSVVFGCVFSDAHYHCGGGTGYGVWTGRHSSDNLIENNIFKRLRHSMIVSIGANNNVFAYNYSLDPVAKRGSLSEGTCYGPEFELSDISVHGNYPNYNLFEHNLVKFIHVDDFWGPAGPGNTFFRNRVYKWNSDTGIKIDGFSTEQFLYGNILPYSSIYVQQENINITEIQNRTVQAHNHQNNDNISESLYLKSRPFFFGNYNWPLFGPDKNLDNKVIPASERNNKGQYFDEFCCGNFRDVNGDIYMNEEYLLVFENDFLYIESFDYVQLDLIIMDLTGKKLMEINDIYTNEPVRFDRSKMPNIILINIITENYQKSFKVIND